MFRFLTNLFAGNRPASRTPAAAPRRNTVRLNVEALEGRITPGGGNWAGDDPIQTSVALVSTTVSSATYYPSAPIYPPGPCVVL